MARTLRDEIARVHGTLSIVILPTQDWAPGPAFLTDWMSDYWLDTFQRWLIDPPPSLLIRFWSLKCKSWELSKAIWTPVANQLRVLLRHVLKNTMTWGSRWYLGQGNLSQKIPLVRPGLDFFTTCSNLNSSRGFSEQHFFWPKLLYQNSRPIHVCVVSS